MAMNKTDMAEAIATKLVSAGLVTNANKAGVKAIWVEICDGLIDHMKSSAVVTVGSDTGTIE